MVAPPGYLPGNSTPPGYLSPNFYQQLSGLLGGLGQGLLAGRNWGQGIGLSLQQGQEGLLAAQQRQQQAEMYDLQKKKLQKELDTSAAEDLVQAVDPADGQLKWMPKSKAAGMGSALPKPAETKSMEALAVEAWQRQHPGEPGPPLDWINAYRASGRPITNVNVKSGPDFSVGEIPKGQILRTDGQGKFWLEDLPGGPQATAATGRQAQAEQTANVIATKVGEAKDIIKNAKLPTTGFVGDLLKQTGGTAANDLRAAVDTIRANVGFDQLNKMRQSSPSGGALGPVSDVENALLQSTIASLDQSQTQEQFIKNLDQVQAVYDKIINGDPDKKLNAGPQSMRATPGAAQKPPNEMSNDELLKALGQ